MNRHRLGGGQGSACRSRGQGTVRDKYEGQEYKWGRAVNGAGMLGVRVSGGGDRPLTLGAVHEDAVNEDQVHVADLAHEAGRLVEGLRGRGRSGGHRPLHPAPSPPAALTHQGDVVVTGV